VSHDTAAIDVSLVLESKTEAADRQAVQRAARLSFFDECSTSPSVIAFQTVVKQRSKVPRANNNNSLGAVVRHE
jgi:hypothetical protein